MHIIFQDTQYVDVVAGEVLYHKDIEIKDDKIAAIAGACTLKAGEIIDFLRHVLPHGHGGAGGVGHRHAGAFNPRPYG